MFPSARWILHRITTLFSLELYLDAHISTLFREAKVVGLMPTYLELLPAFRKEGRDDGLLKHCFR